MAVIGGLAKDPLTGLNKFQTQQKATQAQYGGTYKPGDIVTPPAAGPGSTVSAGAAAGAALGGVKPAPAQTAPVAGAGAGGYNPYAPSAPLAQYQSSYNGPDMKGMTDQLNSIYSNMSASQLQQLKNALAVQQQGYNAQETTANQNAYDGRNSNDVMSMQQMQGLREQMAAQGVNGGDSITAQVANDASRQSGANAINRDQANALQDLAQKRALANSQEASSELSLQQQIDSDKAGAMLNLLQYGDSRAFDVDQAKYGRFSDDLARQFQQSQFEYGKGQDQIQNDAQYGGTYKGGQTFAAQQQQIQNDAQYAGTYGGQQTRAAMESDRAYTADNNQRYTDNQYRDKTYNRGVLESDRNYGRGVFESDRNYGRGVLESDRNYGRGVYESDRNYTYGAGQDAFHNGISQSGDDLQWLRYEQDQANAGGAPKYDGMPVNQVIDALQKRFTDPNTMKQVAGLTPQKIWETVSAYGLPDGQDDQAMISLGMSKEDIAAQDKLHAKK